MAKVHDSITIKAELRPCVANGNKYLFHRWVEFPSDREIFALCEDEDGEMMLIEPGALQFTDSRMDDYFFSAS